MQTGQETFEWLWKTLLAIAFSQIERAGITKDWQYYPPSRRTISEEKMYGDLFLVLSTSCTPNIQICNVLQFNGLLRSQISEMVNDVVTLISHGL